MISRGIAQPGSEPGPEPGSRRFKSSYPDQHSSGCREACVTHLPWKEENGGSNPPAQTISCARGENGRRNRSRACRLTSVEVQILSGVPTSDSRPGGGNGRHSAFRARRLTSVQVQLLPGVPFRCASYQRAPQGRSCSVDEPRIRPVAGGMCAQTRRRIGDLAPLAERHMRRLQNPRRSEFESREGHHMRGSDCNGRHRRLKPAVFRVRIAAAAP